MTGSLPSLPLLLPTSLQAIKCLGCYILQAIQSGEKLLFINPLISATRTEGYNFEGYRGQSRNRKPTKHKEHLFGQLILNSCRVCVTCEKSCSGRSELQKLSPVLESLSNNCVQNKLYRYLITEVSSQAHMSVYFSHILAHKYDSVLTGCHQVFSGSAVFRPYLQRCENNHNNPKHAHLHKNSCFEELTYGEIQ